MSTETRSQISTLRASVVEGRAENVRYRQDQLYALHTALRENADSICIAISNDSESTPEAADTEFYLGMDLVARSYGGLDFDKSLKDEYLVADGKNNEDRRVALGLVTIRPSRHSRFYSILAPLVAAIATGNCVGLELDGSSPSVDTALRGVLVAALDKDTFQIYSSQLNDKLLSEVDVLVDQTSSSQISSLKTVASSPQSRTIAIVDRSSKLELAAEAIVRARISANGFSPYSPDLVIVNEFVVEEFRTACLKYASSLGLPIKKRATSREEKEIQSLVTKQEKGGMVRVRHSGNTDLVVVEILDRKSPLTQMKIDGQYVILLPSSGLVDSVDSQRSSSSILACYVFASLPACKFISEQVSSSATYVNHIPAELLIGPASPLNYAHSLHPRYVPDMFSTPRPQFVAPPKPLPAPSKLKELALKKLLPTGQRPGHAIGFFEQGILVGLGTTALLIFPVIGYSLFFVGKQGWKFLGARLS